MAEPDDDESDVAAATMDVRRVTGEVEARIDWEIRGLNERCFLEFDTLKVETDAEGWWWWPGRPTEEENVVGFAREAAAAIVACVMVGGDIKLGCL